MSTPASQDEDRRSRTQRAREVYAEARGKIRFARSPQGGTPNHYPYLVEDVTAAAVELMMSGLDEYLAASAKTLKSSARMQEVMIVLTVVIGLAAVASAVGTVYGVLHSPKAPVFSAQQRQRRSFRFGRHP